MGKHGPCRHCGVTSTPLWRNGPPEKPVLCNACGSRWRTKGSLANYIPLHVREPIEGEEPKVAKMKSISSKIKEQKLLKRKHMHGIVKSECEMLLSESSQNYFRTFDVDATNRSSSGSAISYSESCANFGAADISDWTGSAQSNAMDSLVRVPSKKRSVIQVKTSPVEKLTKDLYSIWHEQQSSNLSGFSEHDLLLESKTNMDSIEIGHGGVLLRYPSSKDIEEESEASSLPVSNKLMSEAHSRSASFLVNTENKRTRFSNAGIEKTKNSTLHVAQEHAKRDRFSQENLSMLQDRDSPLRFIDLKDFKHKQVTGLNSGEDGTNFLQDSNLTPTKSPQETQNLQLQDSEGTMRSPARVCQFSSTKFPPTKPSALNPREIRSKELLYDEEFVEIEGSCFSPRSLFASPSDQSLMLKFTDDCSDQVLLLDSRSSASLPEPELLYHPWNQKTASNSSMAESCAVAEEESLCTFPASSFNEHN